jgi:hypothetical protein
MAIKTSCEYYRFRSIQRNVFSGTLSRTPSRPVHECHHPANTRNGEITLSSMECNIENHYCPYKIDKKSLLSLL